MKILLVTSFQERYLKNYTLPALAARGVEIVDRFEARHVDDKDLRLMKEQGVELILHMHEVCGHSDSAKLARAARIAGLPVRALSRKKATWDFLPTPMVEEVDDDGPESMDFSALVSARGAEALDTEAAVSVSRIVIPMGSEVEHEQSLLPKVALEALTKHLPEDTANQRVIRFMDESDFDAKTAKLREVVKLLLAIYPADEFDPETREQIVVIGAHAGRDQGLFPRLLKVRGDLDKLVRSMVRQETRSAASEASEASEKKEKTMSMMTNGGAGLEGPEGLQGKDSAPALADGDVVLLRARVAELEKLEQAHHALRTLVRCGYMTPLEAAEKLFGQASP